MLNKKNHSQYHIWQRIFCTIPNNNKKYFETYQLHQIISKAKAKARTRPSWRPSCVLPFYTTNWQKKSSTPLLELSMTTTIRIKEGKTPSETKLSFTYRYSSFRLKVTQLTEELYFDRRIAAWLTGKQWRIFPGIPEQQLARAPAAAVASHHTVAVKKLTTSSFTKKEAATPKKLVWTRQHCMYLHDLKIWK